MNKIVLALLIGLLFITGCNNKEESVIKTKKLIINNDLSDQISKIYTLEDGRIIYSKFEEINYVDSNNKIIELSEALKENKITMDEIMENNSEIDYANDGGSKLYKFESTNISDTDFVIIECNGMDSKEKSIIFGSDSTIIKYCK